MVNGERLRLDEATWFAFSAEGLRTRGRGAVKSAAAGQRTGVAR